MQRPTKISQFGQRRGSGKAKTVAQLQQRITKIQSQLARQGRKIERYTIKQLEGKRVPKRTMQYALRRQAELQRRISGLQTQIYYQTPYLQGGAMPPYMQEGYPNAPALKHYYTPAPTMPSIASIIFGRRR